MYKQVIVTDGRSRASLAIVRSLGRKGIKVTSGESFFCSTFLSKYSNKKIIYPPPDKKPQEFINFLLEEVETHDYDMIIPVRDDATLLLSKNKDKLSKYVKLPVVDYQSLLLGREKSKTLKIAMENDIPCPKTFFIGSFEEIKEIKNKIEYPVLIKPKESSGSRGILRIDSSHKLEVGYRKVFEKYGHAMIQEFIPHGGAYGVSMLFNHGEPKASFTHKRLREYPVSGGPSTLRESVIFPEAEKYAEKLLKILNWHGVAMVEFRVDARSGVPKLMEINPRFWGSLPVAIAAGVDFPYLLYKMTMNGEVESVFNYKVGVKVRWLLMGDILWLLSSENKKKALKEFIKFRGMGYDTITKDDPLPGFGAVAEAVRSFMKRERREHAFERGWNKDESLD